MIRRIGRRWSDASPVKREANGCAARIPDINRIVVPELTASSGAAGGRNPSAPRPVIVTASPLCRTSAPSAATQASVAAQSAPREYPRMTDRPSAIAASIAYR